MKTSWAPQSPSDVSDVEALTRLGMTSVVQINGVLSYDNSANVVLSNTSVEEMKQTIFDEYQAQEYARLRSASYPDIRDQLDMLYHDIASGNIANGQFFTAITDIKTTYPKGE